MRRKKKLQSSKIDLGNAFQLLYTEESIEFRVCSPHAGIDHAWKERYNFGTEAFMIIGSVINQYNNGTLAEEREALSWLENFAYIRWMSLCGMLSPEITETGKTYINNQIQYFNERDSKNITLPPELTAEEMSEFKEYEVSKQTLKEGE